MNNSELNQLIKNDFDMLDIIFKARAEELAKMVKKDIDTLEKTESKTNEEYRCFKESLDVIPDKEYQDIKRKIKDAFIKHTNAIEYREGYFNEKYYKAGIKDGINFIINCM